MAMRGYVGISGEVEVLDRGQFLERDDGHSAGQTSFMKSEDLFDFREGTAGDEFFLRDTAGNGNDVADVHDRSSQARVCFVVGSYMLTRSRGFNPRRLYGD